ncbi:MAG TPA: TRAM domain-containing protein [Methylomirabilota bacterium]|nr:TRAM domain-containing protein [Methylomirabilota bacterium]
MKSPLWAIRILFLSLCVVAGYAVSQKYPELVNGREYGIAIGFGLGGLLIAIDEMLKGFSLRAFSSVTFGLLLGSFIAWLIDTSQLFEATSPNTRWVIRLGLFLGFGYIGIILAMRSNKEDFSLIIPYVRFAAQNKPENPLLLDTSAIIDGRVVDLIESHVIEGLVVVPRFVLKELQFIADSPDLGRRARGRRGLEMLNRIQQHTKNEVKIHESDFPEETEVDAKLVRLTKAVNGKLFTTDFNLTRVAELQSVPCVNVSEIAAKMKPVVLPGEVLHLRIAREGKDKGQGLAYLSDGTMVVVNHAQHLVGQTAHVQVANLLQTGAGVIIFADVKQPETAAA